MAPAGGPEASEEAEESTTDTHSFCQVRIQKNLSFHCGVVVAVAVISAFSAQNHNQFYRLSRFPLSGYR